MTLYRVARPVVKGTIRLCGLGLASVAVGYGTDEGFQRMVDFNRLCVPIFLHYKYVQLRSRHLSAAEREAAFDPLHQVYAPRCLEICLRMQGFYVKLGQVISAATTALPDVYRETLKVLQEDCPRRPFGTILQIVEDELGAPLASEFNSFSEVPIGAASIGQVHAATLRSGVAVVVKVQYPDAERNFNIDMDLFIRACRLLMPEQVGVLEEVQKNFVNEFDYVREAALQRRAAEELNQFSRVVVPLPVDRKHPACPADRLEGLCTKRMLVMDHLRGCSLQRWCRENLRSMAKAQGKTEAQIWDDLQKMTLQDIQSKRPSRISLSMYYGLLAVRDGIRNWSAFYYNWSLGWVGAPIEYVMAPRPVNIYDIVDTILQAQSHCLFVFGFVNGDPHPGNIMLLESGQVGLIDWGQVREYTAEQRCIISRLIIALADKDEFLAAKFAREMGHSTEKGWEWTRWKTAAVYWGSFAEADDLGGPALIEENMHKIDRRVGDYGSFMMAARNMILVRQGIAMLGFPELSTAEAYRGAAVACLLREEVAVPETLPGRCVSRPQALEQFKRAPS